MQGKLRQIITNDRVYTIADQLILTIEFGMATQSSVDLAKNVKRGLTSKAEKGFKPGLPNLGYKCDFTGEKGKKAVFVDEERFPLLRKMVDMMLTGLYTVPQIINIMNEQYHFITPKGIKLQNSTAYKIFTNPFYYGEFEYGGVWYKGSHTPLMPPEEYDKIQLILGRKGKPRPKTHDFAFTGVIKCDCGAMITATEKQRLLTSGGIKDHVYYHCTGRKVGVTCAQKKKGATVEYIELTALDLMNNLDIPQEYIDWAEKYIKDNVAEDRKLIESQLNKLQKDYEVVVTRLNSLIDLKVNNPDILTDEEFRERKVKYTKEKDKILSAINELNENQNKGADEVIDVLNFWSKARRRFEYGDIQTKREIFARLGSKFLLKDKKTHYRPGRNGLRVEK